VNGLIKTTSGPIGPIAMLHNKNGLLGTGHYLRTGAEERISRSRVPYRQRNDDGAVWPEHRYRIELPALWTVVSVSGSVKVLDHAPQLNIELLPPTPIDDAP
jgi:hypothetical protein